MTPGKFWARVQGGDISDCWEWQGPKSRDGYGVFCGVRAHRWAFEYLRDAIPEGLQIDHLCRNPPCVNPWHMEPVTRAENLRRKAAAVTHCPKGHPYDADNTGRHTDNSRRCRECDRARSRERYYRNQSREQARSRSYQQRLRTERSA